MTYVILGSCVLDTACVDACPVDCIHPRPVDPDFGSAEMLYIDPDACVNCNACREACPVDAIAPEDELPADLHVYTALNAGYFDHRNG